MTRGPRFPHLPALTFPCPLCGYELRIYTLDGRSLRRRMRDSLGRHLCIAHADLGVREMSLVEDRAAEAVA